MLKPLLFLLWLRRTARLIWRLLLDRRVPLRLKLIPLAALLYLLSPFDLAPDRVPVLGQLDDLVAVILGLRLFLRACPPRVVAEHREVLSGKVIEGSYKVVEGKPPDKRDGA